MESSGDGIDHWHRYDEDFALLAGLGQNAHRFSLEWSRIEPAEGEFSRAALDHYSRVLESLARHGLSAFTTLYHFTLPQWFAARGGWLAEGALDLFGRYVKVAHTLAISSRTPVPSTSPKSLHYKGIGAERFRQAGGTGTRPCASTASWPRPIEPQRPRCAPVTAARKSAHAFNCPA